MWRFVYLCDIQFLMFGIPFPVLWSMYIYLELNLN